VVADSHLLVDRNAGASDNAAASRGIFFVAAARGVRVASS
jgi:hypothetical protein